MNGVPRRLCSLPKLEPIDGCASVGELSPRGVSNSSDNGKAVVDAGARWQPMEEGYNTLFGSNGLRIFREEQRHPSHQSRLNVKESACFLLKARFSSQSLFCSMSSKPISKASSSSMTTQAGMRRICIASRGIAVVLVEAEHVQVQPQFVTTSMAK